MAPDGRLKTIDGEQAAGEQAAGEQAAGEQADGAAPGSTRARGIDRAIELLECLHAARGPLKIGELARRIKAPRSTAYELVNRFIEAGILESYDEEGRVFFGRTVHFWAADYLSVNDLTKRAWEEVQRLAELSGETTQFCTLQGNKYTVVHMRSGTKMFRISSDIGIEVPIPWTASGRLLLGHLDKEALRRFLPPEDLTLPNGRQLDFDAFHHEIEQAGADGFCITTGLVDSFTQCMAAPVKDPNGQTIATICFVATADKGDEERRRLLDLLIQSGRSLSAPQRR
ncbi:IclR family transcriptional regulator [Aliidongia dinghuensis]|uniref:IclR family transcriptional regulator n=1 Tax=Aliidongia dinghuensis TaxID=1867774 RepID=A0A8J3E2G4_9PROT|nr:IclR family transcriptional regulator [Aliidongia dinghuensis]GGF10055.1 IclR family transcriptional regulator [Aliidongia dinghuensis]